MLLIYMYILFCFSLYFSIKLCQLYLSFCSFLSFKYSFLWVWANENPWSWLNRVSKVLVLLVYYIIYIVRILFVFELSVCSSLKRIFFFFFLETCWVLLLLPRISLGMFVWRWMKSFFTFSNGQLVTLWLKSSIDFKEGVDVFFPAPLPPPPLLPPLY